MDGIHSAFMATMATMVIVALFMCIGRSSKPEDVVMYKGVLKINDMSFERVLVHRIAKNEWYMKKKMNRPKWGGAAHVIVHSYDEKEIMVSGQVEDLAYEKAQFHILSSKSETHDYSPRLLF